MIIISGLSLARVIIYDILFSLFAFFVEPYLLPELKTFTDPYQTGSNILIGILLLAALVLEVPGVYFKFRAIAARMLADRRGNPGESLKLKGGMPVIILHTAISVILMIFAFQALGYRIHSNENIFRVFFLTALIRESIIIYFMFSAKIPRTQPLHSGLKNNIADLLIFFFNIVALTSTWRNITSSDKPLVSDNSGELLLFILFSAILFLIYYLGSSMTTFYEGMIMSKTRRQRYCRLISLLVVTASVLYPLFNYSSPEKQYKPVYDQTDVTEKIKAEQELMYKYHQTKELQEDKGNR